MMTAGRLCEGNSAAADPSHSAMQMAAQALAGLQTSSALGALGSFTLPGNSFAAPGHSALAPMQVPGHTMLFLSPMDMEQPCLQSLTLPEPTGLGLEFSSTTSLQIKWNAVESLLVSPYARSIMWHVEFCKADDTDVLGECEFPLQVASAPVTGLQANCEYKVRLRLQVAPANPGDQPAMASSFTAAVFQTLDVEGGPFTPPKPVVHRVSSTLSEVTILASPCQAKDGSYSCAQTWQLQRLEGALPEDDSREEDWKSVPEVTCSCLHPTTPEIVPSLEKKRVPLACDKIYHFRVRASNDHGSSAWSQIESIRPTPATCEVRVEDVRSLSATLVWSPPEDHGFEIQGYHVYMRKAEDESDFREAVVSTTTEPDGEDGPAVIRYHAQQLQPNCPYKFYVKARSESGLSDPSVACDVVTQSLPPPMPSALTMVKIEPNALHCAWSMKDASEVNFTSVCEVSWRQVTDEDEEACGGQYTKLQWLKDFEDREKWSSKEIPCNDEAGIEYKGSIIGLMSASMYAVQVRGRNGGGDGPFSPAVLQRTTVPPPQQPTTFYSADTTATSTTLSWDQTLDAVYPVTAYQLRTFGPGELDDTAWATIAPLESGDSRLEYMACDLEPGREYSFQVRAVNQHGPGEESDRLTVAMMRDVPPPPGQPTSSHQTASSILLSWRPPVRDNGSEVGSYCLQMRLHRNSEWHTVAEAITNLAVEVSCAEPSTMYLFRVRAHNALGDSLWSDEAMFETMAPPPPLAPQGLAATGTHESVTLNWLHYQSAITGYEVQQQQNGVWVSLMDAGQAIEQQLTRFRRKRSHVDIDTTEAERVRMRPVLTYTRQDLADKTSYSFRVAAKSQGGECFSEAVDVMTRDARTVGTLSDEEVASLRALCEECDCPEYVELLSLGLYDRETLSRLPPDELREVLEQMQVLPKHREKIRTALALPPGPPSKPLRGAVTADSCVFSWDPPEPNGFPVMEYVVEMLPGGEGADSEEVRFELRSTTSTCKVENLFAATEYSVRVAAVNEPKGQGAWSVPVVVHTTDAKCEDQPLLASMRKALNTKEYADKVASQLYHEQWTLKTLSSLAPDTLRAVLLRMRVKEGAVHSIIQQLTGGAN